MAVSLGRIWPLGGALPTDRASVGTALNSFCLRAAVGVPLVLPMACSGIGEELIAKGLPRDCGIANLLLWESAIVALGLPTESRAMALGIALGMP